MRREAPPVAAGDAFAEMPGWFTIANMLEDLDRLVARIGQLTQYSARLKAERVAALEREAAAVRRGSQLQSQLLEQREQAETLQQLLDECEASRLSLQTEVDNATAGLRAEVERLSAENQRMRVELGVREGQLVRLQAVNEEARQRIDAVLERLPGALVAAQETGSEARQWNA
ncbi:hypothetical protein CBF45_02655 [Bordetella sp. J329]|jgi:chromosome segregation ATPase|nr:hypothetical protein CBF45_02655 [Bordetella sp. J329]